LATPVVSTISSIVSVVSYLLEQSQTLYFSFGTITTNEMRNLCIQCVFIQ